MSKVLVAYFSASGVTASLAKKLAQVLGHPVAIVDINDLGANILGFSEKEPTMEWLAKALGDNPLGQSSESTPMGILRKA